MRAGKARLSYAVPCRVALQCAASLFVLQLVLPFALVRQQVTKPGFPQTDRAAQWIAARLQRFGSVLAFARRVAQRTKAL